MATYLLTWNPSKWNWKDLSKDCDLVKKGRSKNDTWSCGNTKKINKGDRFFLLKQGKDLPTGIIGSGYITRVPFPDRHWDGRKADALYVGIKFETLLNPDTDEILERDFLIRDEIFSKINWNTQSSGIEIVSAIAADLEEVWQNFLNESVFYLPEEIEEPSLFYEGATKQITINAYERNPHARKKCIEKYGAECFVCKFDFNKIYGDEIAQNYIHVHHLKQLSEIGEKYEVNPIKDLRSVCPNCHAMIHRRNPPYTIEEIKEFIENQTQ